MNSSRINLMRMISFTLGEGKQVQGRRTEVRFLKPPLSLRNHIYCFHNFYNKTVKSQKENNKQSNNWKETEANEPDSLMKLVCNHIEKITISDFKTVC